MVDNNYKSFITNQLLAGEILSKKLLSVLLSFALLISVSSTVFAAEGKKGQPEFISTANTESVAEVNFKSPPKMHVDDLVEASGLQKVDITKLANFNLSDGKKLANSFHNRSARSVTEAWTGTLANQGEFTYVIAPLAPTQIINATLVCPKGANLNYDLFIYDIDANGNLGSVVAASVTSTYLNIYPDGTVKTVDEGAAFINNTAQTNNYAVIVSATEGGSATDGFELTISLDVKGNYDVAEPNDSAFNAHAVNKGSSTGSSLHVANDQDWYNFRGTSDFSNANISVNAGYKVEVYAANGTKMVLVSQNPSGTYPIAIGANYIRVFADGVAFTPAAYTLTITPRTYSPAEMQVLLNGGEGRDFPDYPQGNTYLRFKNKLCPEVTILSASGHPVPDQLVTLYWESGSWNEGTGNKSRTVTGYTDAHGKVTLVLETPFLPTSLGKYSFYVGSPILFLHHYDFDVIKISANGVNSYTDLVYHFSRSDYIGG